MILPVRLSTTSTVSRMLCVRTSTWPDTSNTSGSLPSLVCPRLRSSTLGQSRSLRLVVPADMQPNRLCLHCPVEAKAQVPGREGSHQRLGRPSIPHRPRLVKCQIWIRRLTIGIRSRGMSVKGLKDYIIGQGASQSQLQLEWDGIWTVNKRVIDPIAPRYWAIAEDKM